MSGWTSDAAFIETHGQRMGVNAVTEAELRARCLTVLTPARLLSLVDLTGPGLAKLGADNRLATADHEIAQRWSRAVWEHPAQSDGILFRSRHDPSRISIAIFDRGINWQQKSLGSLMESSNTALLTALLEQYHFALL